MFLDVPAAAPTLERRARPREALRETHRGPRQGEAKPHEPVVFAIARECPEVALADKADAALLRRACDGCAEAIQRLIEQLLPAVRSCIHARLQCATWQGDPTRSVEDLCQELFLQLFANNSRVLRRWAPGKGLSLSRFVALVADRLVITELRRKQHSHGAFEIDDCADQLTDPARAPEDWLNSQQCLSLLHAALLERLSPLGQRMFELLFVQELDIELISQRLDMGADAIYAWRSRLRKQAICILRLAGIENFSEVRA